MTNIIREDFEKAVAINTYNGEGHDVIMAALDTAITAIVGDFKKIYRTCDDPLCENRAQCDLANHYILTAHERLEFVIKQVLQN